MRAVPPIAAEIRPDAKVCPGHIVLVMELDFQRMNTLKDLTQ